MKPMKWLGIAALLALCPLSGCMTVGDKFDMAVVQRFQPGVTTRADAERQLGAPMSITNMADGSVLLQWMYTQAVYVSAESKHVALLFGVDGKFVRVVQQTQTHT